MKSIGQSSEEDPPHKVTAGELLKLLQHPNVDLDKPLCVKVPMGWADVCYVSINYSNSVHIHLSEEWH